MSDLIKQLPTLPPEQLDQLSKLEKGIEARCAELEDAQSQNSVAKATAWIDYEVSNLHSLIGPLDTEGCVQNVDVDKAMQAYLINGLTDLRARIEANINAQTPVGFPTAKHAYIHDKDLQRLRLAESKLHQSEKRVGELTTQLAYAEDAAKKGDLARQNAAGIVSDGIKPLPCPFCGEPAEIDLCRGYRSPAGKLGNSVAVYCSTCSADMSLCEQDHPNYSRETLRDSLLSMWNHRQETADLRLLVMALYALPHKMFYDKILFEIDFETIEVKAKEGSPQLTPELRDALRKATG
jgi:hypothetical protein